MKKKGKSPRVFSREFKLEAVRRMQAGESPSALSRELDVRRKLLYEWKQRVEEGGAENLRSRGRPTRTQGPVRQPPAAGEQRRIAELERLVGKQQATGTFAYFEVWFATALLYLVLTLPLSAATRLLQRKLGGSTS